MDEPQQTLVVRGIFPPVTDRNHLNVGSAMTEAPSLRRPLAVALASVAGFVDAAGYLALNIFSAHMSGNSARLGVYLSGGIFQEGARAAYAIVLFVIGIAVGTATVELLVRTGRRSAASVVLGAEVLLLVILAVVGDVVAAHGRISQAPAAFYPLAGLAVLAMGLQTSTLQRVSGRTVRTTYVSGMLTNLAEEAVAYVLGSQTDSGGHHPSFVEGELGLRAGPASLRRIRLIAAIWVAYVAGAVVGGWLERTISPSCLGVPAAVLVVIVFVERREAVRHDPAPTGG